MAAYSFIGNALSRFHALVKDAVDPNGILAAGRYGIWPKHMLPVWMDRAGNIHNGGTARGRYTLIDQNHLRYEATIEDPSTFSRPWTIEMPLYRRMEPNAAIFEYKCIEIAEPLIYGELLNGPIS
ncbi:hypothetical protein [Candidatus Rariloculus sp.]|uniref:hypothetical protein n=1 Tax=Candidatus Rariloculus sp. TaxID=3101265 RepID=UPI003D0AD870